MAAKPLIIGNWKLNHLKAKTQNTIQAVLKGLKTSKNADIAIAPVATLLQTACELTQNSSLQVAAQNVFYESQGAFTGEWSPQHLTELGVTMAIIGHSERRQYFAESSEQVGLKAKACLEAGIMPIVCIGESLSEHESGQTLSVLSHQLEPIQKHIASMESTNWALAYEPIWAIGTGVNASVVQVTEAHAELRDLVGPNVRLLYGGSVKPENASELAQIDNVNGFLVGGASLEADSFLKIIVTLAQARV